MKYDELCGFLFMAWGLHYFPFFLMARQLFLHHYLPALYFAILLFCAVFDVSTANIKSRIRFQVAAAFIVIAILCYSFFNPLTYGGMWTKAKCNRAKWVKSWDFACNDFYDNVSTDGMVQCARRADCSCFTSTLITNHIIFLPPYPLQ